MASIGLLRIVVTGLDDAAESDSRKQGVVCQVTFNLFNGPRGKSMMCDSKFEGDKILSECTFSRDDLDTLLARVFHILLRQHGSKFSDTVRLIFRNEFQKVARRNPAWKQSFADAWLAEHDARTSQDPSAIHWDQLQSAANALIPFGDHAILAPLFELIASRKVTNMDPHDPWRNWYQAGESYRNPGSGNVHKAEFTLCR
jgi:hypothetical protein